MISTLPQYLFNVIIHSFLTCPLLDPTTYMTNCLTAVTANNWHYIIVGGGSAGAVIANRLSANPGFQVLVLEAGLPPPGYTEIPGQWMQGRTNPTSIDWGFQPVADGNTCTGYNNNRCTLHQGRVAGGSSLLTDTLMFEGTSNDWDSWGSTSWNWTVVKPYVQAINNLYGNSGNGLFSVTTPTASNDPRGSASNEKIRTASNMTVTSTYGARTGYQYSPTYVRNGRRLSTAKAYLLPAVQRSNLCIAYNARVKKINFDTTPQKNAISVNVYIGTSSTMQTVPVLREVIVTAGAIKSPQLLMASGIGPATALQNVGIPVVVDLPGVGQNLHGPIAFPMFYMMPQADGLNYDWNAELDTFCTNASNSALGTMRDYNLVGYLNSNVTTSAYNMIDAQIKRQLIQRNDFIVGPQLEGEANWISITYTQVEGYFQTGPMLLLWLTLQKPASRGYMTINNADFDAPPVIYANILDTSTYDAEAIKNMIVHVKGVFSSSSNTLTNYNIFPSQTCSPCLPTNFDTVPFWSCMVNALTRLTGDVGGTCRMGNNPLTNAVVNEDLQVYGVHGLRVADSSIAPTLGNADVQTRNMIIGELAAVYIARDYYLPGYGR